MVEDGGVVLGCEGGGCGSGDGDGDGDGMGCGDPAIASTKKRNPKCSVDGGGAALPLICTD